MSDQTKQKHLTRWKDMKVWVIAIIVFSLILAAIRFLIFYTPIFIHGSVILQYASVFVLMCSAFFVGLGVLVIIAKTITFNARAKIPTEQSLNHFVVYHGKVGCWVLIIISGSLFLFSVFGFDFGRFGFGWDVFWAFLLCTNLIICVQCIKDLAFKLEVCGDEMRLKKLFTTKVFSIYNVKSVKTKYQSHIALAGGHVNVPMSSPIRRLFLYSNNNQTGHLLSVGNGVKGYRLLVERLSEQETLHASLDPFELEIIRRIKLSQDHAKIEAEYEKVKAELAKANMEEDSGNTK